jgi:hypothetical protein
MTNKERRSYSIDGKYIEWSRDKYRLYLTVKILETDYESGKVLLPPLELGRCDNWYFSSEEGGVLCFKSNWELRRVKDKLENIEKITTELSMYALDYT